MSGSGISWVICKSAPRSRQITTPAPHPPLSFLQAGCPSCRPTNSVKALKGNLMINRKIFSKSGSRLPTSQIRIGCIHASTPGSALAAARRARAAMSDAMLLTQDHVTPRPRDTGRSWQAAAPRVATAAAAVDTTATRRRTCTGNSHSSTERLPSPSP